jgi:hypothetical protein
MLDHLQTPVTAFVTFRTEEGYYRATKPKDDHDIYKEVLGVQLEIKGASQPTDIIWENRYITSR